MDENAFLGPTAPLRDNGHGGVGLLIIDMINAFDFEGGDMVAP
jgi:hypothetical protein